MIPRGADRSSDASLAAAAGGARRRSLREGADVGLALERAGGEEQEAAFGGAAEHGAHIISWAWYG